MSARRSASQSTESLTLSIQVDNIIEYRKYSLQSRLPFGPFQRNSFDHIVLTKFPIETHNFQQGVPETGTRS